MKKFFLAFNLFLLAINISSCNIKNDNEIENKTTKEYSADNKEFTKYKHDFWGSFDTLITVIAHTKTEEEFADLNKYAEERFRELHSLYDVYHNYGELNNIKTINDNAGVKPIEVSQEIIDLVLVSKEWYEKSDKKLNIALGPVLNVWHKYRDRAEPYSDENEIPKMKELEEESKYIDFNKVIIDKENNTIFLSEKNMSLDVGSVAKGYATELVCDELIKKGYDSFSISAGGNVKTVGKPKDKETWIIGVQKPEEGMSLNTGEQLLGKTYVNDLSVVTSGDYQRYFYSNGKKYHHIIDPNTLMPADFYRAITILHEDSGISDILSTILFLMPIDEALEFVENIEGAEALFVMPDESVKMSSGMERYYKSS